MEDLASFFRGQSLLIPNSAHLPSYKVLQMVILVGIENGLWKSGEMLPPERKLAAACGMSIGTVKRSMLELVHQGVLFRRQGSGTYVAGSSFHRQYRRYYLRLKDFGGQESENAVSLQWVRRIPSMPAINAALGLEKDEELYEIARLFNENGLACVLAYSYVSALKFSDLHTLCRAKLERVPLFILFEEEYKTPTLKTDELFAAVSAEAAEVKLLGIQPDTPLLQIKSLMYTRLDKPFEYRISYCLTKDRYIVRTIV